MEICIYSWKIWIQSSIIVKVEEEDMQMAGGFAALASAIGIHANIKVVQNSH